MQSHPSHSASDLTKARVETLADGVFAIAMTLLVLNIKVPDVPHARPAALAAALLAQWPKYVSYVISFLMLGIYWVGHHNQFHAIRRSDRGFLWINILYLMAISFLPFSTALLGEYPQARIALVIYGGNLIVVSLLLYWHWRYATDQHRLVDADLDPHIVRLAARRILMGPVIYLAAIVASLLSATASLAIYLVAPLIFIFPGKIDGFWRSR
jgi:uncharacterized membrane protein